MVKPGKRFRYKLPALTESEGVGITVANSRPDSLLSDCDCYKLRRNRMIIDLTLPEDWPSEEFFDILMVYLSLEE